MTEEGVDVLSPWIQSIDLSVSDDSAEKERIFLFTEPNDRWLQSDRRIYLYIERNSTVRVLPRLEPKVPVEDLFLNNYQIKGHVYRASLVRVQSET
jgi:hypothetical protein